MKTDSKYIYYVKCKIGNNTWLTDFLITCNNIDKILPMLNNAGLDNQNAYGEPKDPNIIIHHVQRFAICRHYDAPDGLIQMYQMYCDIKPNDLF